MEIKKRKKRVVVLNDIEKFSKITVLGKILFNVLLKFKEN